MKNKDRIQKMGQAMLAVLLGLLLLAASAVSAEEKIVASEDTFGEARDMAVVGNLVYVADDDRNLPVITGIATPNDNFADAAELMGMSGDTAASNEFASREAGEPDHAGNISGKSVWWAWPAPVSGWFSFDTHGSDFDTILAVYDGSDLANLSAIAANDDDGSDNGNSSLFFQTQGGKWYYIAAEGSQNKTGDIALNWKHIGPKSDQLTMALSGLAYAEGEKITSGGYVIAAFGPGGYSDCRGVSGITESDGERTYHLTVTSDTDGEVITFRIWDNNSFQAHNLGDTVVFEAGAAIRKSLGMPLKTESVYPQNGVVGENSEITLSGTGFDENTKVSVRHQESGNEAEIDSVTLISETSMVLTFPGPAEPGRYTLKVYEETETHEFRDALTFAPNWIPVSGTRIMKVFGGVWAYGDRVGNSGYTIAAFGPGGEDDCRGKAEVIQSGGEWAYSLFIASDAEGEDITFRIWDSNSGQLLAPDDKIVFSGFEITEQHINRPLSAESVSLALAEVGKDQDVTLTGTGFDENTKISIYRDVDSKRNIIGSWQSGTGLISPQDIDVVGNIGYVADNSGDLKLIDVSRSEHPVVIASVDIPCSSSGVAVRAETAYVASTCGLQVIDVSRPEHPVVKGQVDIPTKYYDDIRGVAVKDTTAYVACGHSGLQMIDVSDPEHPVLIASVDSLNFAGDVAINGDTIYVVSWSNVLRIMDVSQPKHPVTIAFVTTSLHDISGVAVKGDTLCLADKEGGLQMIDVSDPEHPVVIASADTPNSPKGLAVKGDRAYVASGEGGLQIMDISHPESPFIISSVNVPYDASGLLIIDDTAYLAYDGFQVIDVSDPERPVAIGSVRTPGQPRSLAITGGIAYVADGRGGLQVINVSDPEHPAIIGSAETSGFANGVAVKGSTAYVTCGDEDSEWNGLQVIDVSDPETPFVVSSVSTSSIANGVAIEGKRAYVACGGHYSDWDGLMVINVSDPENPFVIASAETLNFANNVAVKGDMAYVACGNGDWKWEGLQVINVGAPESPAVIASVDTPSTARGIAVVGDKAYVACGGSFPDWNGLQVIDVNSPEDPVVIGSVDISDSALNVALTGDTAYVACRDRYSKGNSLQAIRVSNPDHLTGTGFLGTPDSAAFVAVRGDTAYVADGYSGLQVADVSDPKNPVIVGFADTPDFARSVVISEDTAYVACGSSYSVWKSLQVINVSQPEHPTAIASVETPNVVQGLAVERGTAYVVCSGEDSEWTGLQVLDVSQPEHPALVASLEAWDNETWRSIAVKGNIAYVTSGNDSSDWDGLRVIDMSNLENPAIIGSAETPYYLWNIVAEGDTAYATGLYGLQVIDISQPESPAIIASVDISGRPFGIATAEHTVYVESFAHGLEVIDVSQPEHPIIITSLDAYYGIGISAEGDTIYMTGSSGGIMTMNPVPVVITPDPDSYRVESDTRISFTLPDIEDTGSYTLMVHNEKESHELRGAITFADPEEYQQQERKKAIIVAGGLSPGDSLWNKTWMCANHARRALEFQGYDKDRIYYLAPGGDSLDDDTDGTASLETLEHAITEWGAADTDELLIYMTGPGKEGVFHLSENEILKAEDLDNWLDELQEASSVSVILIYDACRAGSFIEPLTPPTGRERILITGSAPDQHAVFTNEGRISFSYQFWTSISLNANLYEAFIAGKEAVGSWQTPYLDGDGDGIGYAADAQDVPGSDKQIARNTMIGRGWITASEAPAIGFVSGEQTLSGETSASLQAGKITATDEIVRVRALITPPNHRYGPDDPVTDLPEITLEDPEGIGVYKGTWKGFCQEGTYHIAVYAAAEGVSGAETVCSAAAKTAVIQTAGSPALPGDLDGDGGLGLKDVVIALKVLSGTPGLIWYDYAASDADVSGDAQIGTEEVFHIFEKLSE